MLPTAAPIIDSESSTGARPPTRPARSLLALATGASLAAGGSGALVWATTAEAGPVRLVALGSALLQLTAAFGLIYRPSRARSIAAGLAGLLGLAGALVGPAAGLRVIFALGVLAGALLLVLDWQGPRLGAQWHRAGTGAILLTAIVLVSATAPALASTPPLLPGFTRSSPAAGPTGVTPHHHELSTLQATTTSHNHDGVAVVSTNSSPGTATLTAHDHVVASGSTLSHDHTLVASPTTPVSPTEHNHLIISPPTPGPSGPSGPSGPIISLDDPRLTSAQRARATDLLFATRSALTTAGLTDLVDEPLKAALTAAGYQAIGDGGTFAHWVHWGRYSDGVELDATSIESVVLEHGSDGHWRLGSAMYVLNEGRTLANVPEIAGELTTWHLHTNLCWEGTLLVGVTQGGVCARGELRVTPPMLHVWLSDGACGPFAETEERSSGVCSATHTH